MGRREEVIHIAGETGLIRAEDVEDAGISRNYLYMLTSEGVLERVARGVYALPDRDADGRAHLVEVAKRVPKAVISLISALTFHELTTQVPNEVWITLPRGAWTPDFDYPRLQITYVSGDAYRFGIETHEIEGVGVKVYDPAKTIADCFKFRNHVGLDVAVEALRTAWHDRKVTADELWSAASIDRVTNVIRPYMEAIA